MNLNNIYTFDTEFIDDGETIDFISIGIVRMSDFSSLYLVSNEFDSSKANDFVKENVLPYLNTEITYSKKAIREQLESFIIHSNPEFWCYYGSYDWVTFCQLFGLMIDLPDNYPKYFNEIKQELNRLDLSKEFIPKQSNILHNALNDALYNADLLKLINHYINNPIPLKGAFTEEEFKIKYKYLYESKEIKKKPFNFKRLKFTRDL